MRNRCVVLAARPEGVAAAEDFRIESREVGPVAEGGLLVRNRFLSVEPAMRGWIADAANYSSPVEIGSVMRALAVGEVVESRCPAYAPGDWVMGWFGWQTYADVEPAAVERKVTEADLSPTLSLGVLGINGLTAFFGLTRIGAPKPGETVVVSTAAGAVGSAVGQIAKIAGCRTIGVAGGEEKKRRCVEEFGYDAAIDYRGEDVGERLRALSPDGVDVYFDNTSGPISDAVMRTLAVGARVAICGTASLSSWSPWPLGPRVERHLLVRRARMQGFLYMDFRSEFPQALAQLAGWVRQGRLRFREDILQGIESCPGALSRLYRGENAGKLLVRLED